MHFFLYIGSGVVLHQTGERVELEYLDDVISYTNGECSFWGTEPDYEALRKGLSDLGVVSYNLLEANCEHYLNYWKTGRWTSIQRNKFVLKVKTCIMAWLIMSGLKALEKAGQAQAPNNTCSCHDKKGRRCRNKVRRERGETICAYHKKQPCYNPVS